MDQIRTLLSRCASFFRRQRLDEDLDQELRSHIQLAMEENMQQGMPEQEARTAALRAFGGVTQTKESYRVQRGLPFVEILWSDLRYAVRQLCKTPWFTLTTALTLRCPVSQVAVGSAARLAIAAASADCPPARSRAASTFAEALST